MNIPSSIKIGARTYSVSITELFDCGTNQTGVIDYRALTIGIRPMAREAMEQTLLHEIIHGMLNDMGFDDHDEFKVDAMANELHRIIKDNPTLFEPFDKEKSIS